MSEEKDEQEAAAIPVFDLRKTRYVEGRPHIEYFYPIAEIPAVKQALASGVPEAVCMMHQAPDPADKVSLLVENDQLRQRLARMEQRLAEHEARLAILEGLEDQRAEGRE